MAKQGFTDPKLFNYNGDLKKEWYVGFRHTDPVTGIRKPFQIRMGINHHPDTKGRMAEGKAVTTIVANSLYNDWNPHTEEIKAFLIRTAPVVEKLKTFTEGLKFALESKKPNLESKSYSDIKGVMDFAIKAAEKIGIAKRPIIETQKKHIKMLVEQMGKDRQAAYDKKGKGMKFSGNSYNKYKSHLSLLFTELEDYEEVLFNPCTKVTSKREITTNLHRHATQKEKELIQVHLKEHYPDFYTFLAFETLAGLRPQELLNIKIADIDLLNQRIVLPYSKGKNDSTRFVPLPNSLMIYFHNMEIERYPNNYFIFSIGFLPGSKCMGNGRADYATRAWKKSVKEELALNVSLYSFKGLGGEEKRKAGISASAVSSQYGHSSMNMTNRYLHGEQDRINKEIIEKTPEF
jgi:integrase